MEKISKNKLDKISFDAIVKEEKMAIMILGPDESDCYWELNFGKVPFVNKKIMIRNPDYGIEPEAYFLNDNVIGIGVDLKFYLIYKNDKIKEIDLPCLFYTIAWEYQNKIIIRHEIGFVGVSIDDGSIIWEQDTDLLNTYEIKDGRIYYETFEGKKGKIKIPVQFLPMSD